MFWLTFNLAEFVDYFKYVFKLSFRAIPNYEYLRQLFRKILARLPQLSYEFDWDAPCDVVQSMEQVIITTTLTSDENNQNAQVGETVDS